MRKRRLIANHRILITRPYIKKKVGKKYPIVKGSFLKKSFVSLTGAQAFCSLDFKLQLNGQKVVPAVRTLAAL